MRKLQGAQGRGRRKPRRNIPSATERSGIVAGQPDRIGSEIDARLFQTLISALECKSEIKHGIKL